MKLSILDQAPISSNQSPFEALNASLKLAKAGEEMNYSRFWIAEHHSLPGLACSSPEVMLSYIGANTTTIRIGSGAVLLPHYRPYKVAEQYHTLATLFPGRIDVGIGRAPGGSAEATEALSEKFLEQVWKMPELLEELLHFIHQDFPAEHRFSNLRATPLPDYPPEVWLLGTSKKSALLAAKNGIPYAFGQFMSEENGADIIKQYTTNFQSNGRRTIPRTIIAVSVICAETTEKAYEVAFSSLIWSLQKNKGLNGGIPTFEEAIKYQISEQDLEMLDSMKRKMIIGNPLEVKQSLFNIKERYNVDEMMIVTITSSLEDKIHSYKLIAEAVGNV